jgi:bifunctional non-homologous end joining protein LigD
VKTELTIGKRAITVSNLEKVLYPAARFTRAEVVAYYSRIAPVILPHLRDRPVTLKRFPDGIHGEAFYEKDAPEFTPPWVKTFPVPRRDATQPPIKYIIINDAATLVWAAANAALELHPFLHRAPAIETPTYVAFDLDPGEGADILQCAEVAFLLRDALRKLDLQSFPKVSGSKGIQVYVPLNSPVTYESTQPFARALAELLARQHPDWIVSEMAKVLRRGKVFIDWSQNADHKTTISVYSLRAKGKRPYVSLPVEWRELETSMRKGDADGLYWEAKQALERVKKTGDLFAPLLKLKQTLPAEFKAHRTLDRRGKSPKSLRDYEAKRNFARTAEPAATPVVRRSAQGSRRRFVVQKHAASHLHYDFRLEMNDVLKSWAVPKGVPLKDEETATAIATEDHPIGYLQFEGTIPQGEYGGGTVMVWDIGTYEIVEGNYWKGRISVYLAGKKLRGEWTLEKKDEQDGKIRWALTKTSGDARPISPKQAQVSTLSGRRMEEIAEDTSAVWNSDHASASTIAPPPSELKQNTALDKKAATPVFVPVMKATVTAKLPEGPEWIYEVKWDGYRVEAIKNGRTVRLLSLKGKNLNADFPQVVAAVREIKADTATLDGEVVAVNAEGRPSFQVLQNRKSLGRGWHIVYYAFDLLNFEGEDLTRVPLQQRKQKLKAALGGSDVRCSDELPGDPDAIVSVIKKAGLEGIVAKRLDSEYRTGARVTSWLKLKLDQAQEFVIGGYNPNGKTFQSLLLGYYESGKLIFAGKVRQGFNGASRASLMTLMKPLVVTRCPFANLPSSRTGHFGEGVTAEDMPKLIWVRPKLIAQCRFTEWTNYGVLRHATYLGLRQDKEPFEVVREEVRKTVATES